MVPLSSSLNNLQHIIIICQAIVNVNTNTLQPQNLVSCKDSYNAAIYVEKNRSVNNNSIKKREESLYGNFREFSDNQPSTIIINNY